MFNFLKKKAIKKPYSSWKCTIDNVFVGQKLRIARSAQYSYPKAQHVNSVGTVIRKEGRIVVMIVKNEECRYHVSELATPNVTNY